MKTYKARDYFDAINAFAPFSLAESWDNSGLLIGSPEKEVAAALVALDANVAVIAEAADAGAQLVVAHHPIIFSGMKSVPAGGAVYRAIREDIAVLCAHTNLDIAPGGVNDLLAGLLGLRDIQILETTSARPYRKVSAYIPSDSAEDVYSAMVQAGGGNQGDYAGAAFISDGEGRFLPLEGANPAIGKAGRLEKVREKRLEMLVSPGRLEAVVSALRKAHPYEEPAFDIFETHFDTERLGLGRIGNLSSPLDPESLARRVKEKLGISQLRYVPGKEEISRVAVCGGAGSDLLERAMRMGAQALVSSEAKRSHILLAQDLGMTLIDAGHYGTEAIILPALLEKLREALPGADIRGASACCDPCIAL